MVSAGNLRTIPEHVRRLERGSYREDELVDVCIHETTGAVEAALQLHRQQ